WRVRETRPVAPHAHAVANRAAHHRRHRKAHRFAFARTQCGFRCIVDDAKHSLAGLYELRGAKVVQYMIEGFYFLGNIDTIWHSLDPLLHRLTAQFSRHGTASPSQ